MKDDVTPLRSLVWQNLQFRGEEHFSLSQMPDAWLLEGSVTVDLEGQSMRVKYEIECDADWRTRMVTASCLIGSDSRHLTLNADGKGNWTRNGVIVPVVRGCMDVDLSVTPATNTLPIRRLNFETGTPQRVTAAWLRFPELTLEPLSQTYTRLAADRYRYESDTGFATELTVDELGLVVSYPPGWRRVTAA